MNLSCENKKGSAIIIVVLLMAMLAFIPVMVQLTAISYQKTQHQINVGVQADYAARAGVMDAISWFKRQTLQPVRQTASMTYADAAFNPQENVDLSLSDTVDQEIGIVQTYAINSDGDIWARYEVKKQSDTAVAAYDSHAVHDITNKRVEGYAAGAGLAWYIESVGYVYKMNNSNVAFNVAPNILLATSRASTEIRRISLTLPANCAVIVSTRSTTITTLTSNSRITGATGIGMGYYSGTTGPNVSGSSITGTPSLYNIATASVTSINPDTIFGVTKSDFKNMADVSVSTLSSLSSTYPEMSIVYVGGEATFDSVHQLRGSGILYVDGNLTLQSESNSYFSGLIYVAGNCVIKGPATVSGAMVVKGTFSMNGNGDAAEVLYDDGVLSTVRQQVAQYRENKSTYFNYSGLQ